MTSPVKLILLVCFAIFLVSFSTCYGKRHRSHHRRSSFHRHSNFRQPSSRGGHGRHNMRNILTRLAEMGYADPMYMTTANTMSEDEVMSAAKPAIRKMNAWYHGRNDESISDDMTLLTEQPYCGNADPAEAIEGNRKKRWTRLGSATWDLGKMPISYGFKSFASDLSRDEQWQLAKECAILWAQESGLSFKRDRRGQPTLKIAFSFIDGESKTLGRAYSPQPWKGSTDITLDSGDRWNRIKLKGTLCHEMGHALGLGHSRDRSAIMYPSLGPHNLGSEVRLKSDDKRGIVALYGGFNGKTYEGGNEPESTDPPRTRPPRTNPPKTRPPRTNPPRTRPPRTNPPRTNPPRHTTSRPRATRRPRPLPTKIYPRPVPTFPPNVQPRGERGYCKYFRHPSNPFLRIRVCTNNNTPTYQQRPYGRRICKRSGSGYYCRTYYY